MAALEAPNAMRHGRGDASSTAAWPPTADTPWPACPPAWSHCRWARPWAVRTSPSSHSGDVAPGLCPCPCPCLCRSRYYTYCYCLLYYYYFLNYYSWLFQRLLYTILLLIRKSQKATMYYHNYWQPMAEVEALVVELEAPVGRRSGAELEAPSYQSSLAFISLHKASANVCCAAIWTLLLHESYYTTLILLH